MYAFYGTIGHIGFELGIVMDSMYQHCYSPDYLMAESGFIPDNEPPKYHVCLSSNDGNLSGTGSANSGSISTDNPMNLSNILNEPPITQSQELANYLKATLDDEGNITLNDARITFNRVEPGSHHNGYMSQIAKEFRRDNPILFATPPGSTRIKKVLSVLASTNKDYGVSSF